MDRNTGKEVSKRSKKTSCIFFEYEERLCVIFARLLMMGFALTSV
jgi:hypothetical protein